MREPNGERKVGTVVQESRTKENIRKIKVEEKGERDKTRKMRRKQKKNALRGISFIGAEGDPKSAHLDPLLVKKTNMLLGWFWMSSPADSQQPLSPLYHYHLCLLWTRDQEERAKKRTRARSKEVRRIGGRMEDSFAEQKWLLISALNDCVLQPSLASLPTDATTPPP